VDAGFGRDYNGGMSSLQQNGHTSHDIEAVVLALDALSFSLVCFSIILLYLHKWFNMRAAVLLLASVLCGLVVSKYEYTYFPLPSLFSSC